MQNELSAGKPAGADPLPGEFANVPPLRVWLTVGVLTVIMALVPYPSYRKWVNDTSFTSDNVKRIEKFSAGPAGSKRVIMIGSSVLHSATFYDDKMNAFAATNGCEGMLFLRISQKGLAFRHAASVLEPAIDSKPDLLLIQADILLTDTGDTPYGIYLSDALRSSLNNVMSRKRKRTKNLLENNEQPIDAEQYEEAFRRYTKILQRRLAARRPERLITESILLRAKQTGVRVIILEMPRPEKTSDLIKSIGDRDYKDEWTWLKGLSLASHLCYPAQLGLDQFRDFAHLSEKGRSKFSLWLVRSIRDELERGSGRQ